jgi:hypothetical protein
MCVVLACLRFDDIKVGGSSDNSMSVGFDVEKITEIFLAGEPEDIKMAFF